MTGRVWWDVAENTKTVLTAEQQVPSVVIPAEWKPSMTGTMEYGFYYLSGTPLYESHEAVLYEDVNHPGVWKIAPYADSELLLEFDSSDESFYYPVQIVGTVDGSSVRVADWDADQGSDHADDPSYRGYWDDDEQAWLFMSIWRMQGADGKWALTCYGYDAFIPDSE